MLAFSLTDQHGALSTTLPPEAFNGQNAYLDMVGLARKYPNREPGSAGDDALAAAVATAFRKDGLAVNTHFTTARTAVGTRTLQTVTGVLPGLSGGSIVVIAHRDSLHSPAAADLSGTAVLVELGRVLAGQTQHRSVYLFSTSGSAGAAGATALARTLPRPVDAVIVLGDLAGTRAHSPVIVPWSNSQAVTPTVLRNTLAAAVTSQAGLPAGSEGLAGQLAHLAFPLSVTDQGPFGAHGYPTALLSLSSARPPATGEAVDPGRIDGMGRSLLQTVNALDTGPAVPAPSADLLYGGKVIPAWAIRILVLGLIIPVLLASVDGMARARRRGYPLLRSVVWVLAAALPFLVGLLIVLGARLIGALKASPPGPVAAGAIPLGGGGIAVLAVLALAIGLSYFAWRRLAGALPGERPGAGRGAALMLVLCGVALVIWARNPFAAVLLVPALHLWLWVADPDVRMPRGVSLALLVAGLTPPVLVVVYYALSLGLSPLDVLWNGLLLVAGGYLGIAAVVQWSVVLGCVASAISITLRRPRHGRPSVEPTPITVRGPVTYAGPGSLGGTESALRR
jgi:hypothetical protein